MKDKPIAGLGFVFFNVSIISTFLILWALAAFKYEFTTGEIILSFVSVLLFSLYFILQLVAAKKAEYEITPDAVKISFGMFKGAHIPRGEIKEAKKIYFPFSLSRIFGKHNELKSYGTSFYRGIKLVTEQTTYYLTPENTDKFLNKLFPAQFPYTEPAAQNIVTARPSAPVSQGKDPKLMQLELEDDAYYEYESIHENEEDEEEYEDEAYENEDTTEKETQSESAKGNNFFGFTNIFSRQK
ncbi:MAG TPA: hypothetical protein DCQ31_17715 [Bacteroidales bacterium]|nr:hypothetical protein [Bacteroidales bacterium]